MILCRKVVQTFCNITISQFFYRLYKFPFRKRNAEEKLNWKWLVTRYKSSKLWSPKNTRKFFSSFQWRRTFKQSIKFLRRIFKSNKPSKLSINKQVKNVAVKRRSSEYRCQNFQKCFWNIIFEEKCQYYGNKQKIGQEDQLYLNTHFSVITNIMLLYKIICNRYFLTNFFQKYSTIPDNKNFGQENFVTTIWN